MKPTLYMLCGPSGCGKSYWAKQFLMGNFIQAEYISRDKIRFGLINDNDDYFAHEDETFKVFVNNIVENLIAGKNVIADATHLTVKSRKKLTNAIDKYFTNYNITYIVILTTIERALEQNNKREGKEHVPEEQIIQMFKRFVHPSMTEDKRANQIWDESSAEEHIYLTSDTHFCHNKEFLWSPRGFSSVKEMNEAIVERWNSIIPNIGNYTIYHLGDLALMDTDSAIDYVRQLHGQIKWIRGNHCTDNRVQQILKACPEKIELISPDIENAWAYVLKDGKWRFYLSHYPTKVANFDDIGTHKTWCLCGHSHTKDKWQDLADSCYHVEMDAHDCYPVSLEQIKADIIALKQNHNITEQSAQNFKIK